MNRYYKTFFITLILALLILPVAARTATDTYQSGRSWDMTWQDIGQLNMTVTNYGIFGHNVLTGDAGGYWPSGYPGENYIYGCGVWFGALVDTLIDGSDTLRDTLVSIGYNPNSGSSEMVPGDAGDKPLYTNTYEIVYKSTSNWPPKDADGNVIFDSTVSMQDLYCEYSDKDPGQHLTIENLPLGIEIYQSNYAWVGPLKEDIIFMVYRVKNANEDGDNLNNCYIGVCTDNDIGNESGSSANDLLGFIDTITVDGDFKQMNLGYQFQLDPEAGWSHDPGIVAFKYMQSPIATEDVDVYHDGSIVIDSGQEIGMSTFNYFTLATDPSTKQERYQVMAGYDHLNFDPNNPEAYFRPFPDWGEGTAGYPGQTQSEAGDKRFIMASGPFSLPNESMTTVVVAVMVAKNVDELLDKAITAQSVFDAGFKGPVAPEIVNFTAKGMNEKVMLYWDNSVEKIADKYYEDASDPTSLLYNPAYKEFDVEGYNIYSSPTGAGGTYELLAKYDLLNDITAVISDSTIVYDQNGNATITYIYESLGTNTGVPYFYCDSNLTNGITYHYMITAYDYNFSAYAVQGTDTIGTQPLFLEGAGKDVSAQPRMPTLNYTATTYEEILDTTFYLYDYYTYDSTSTETDTVELGEITVHPVENLELAINPVVDTLIEKLPEGTTFSFKFTGINHDATHPIYAYEIYKNVPDGAGGYTSTKSGEKAILMENYTFVTDEGDAKTIWKRAGSEAVTSDGITFDVKSYQVDQNTWPTLDTIVKIEIYGTYNQDIMKYGFSPNAMKSFRGSKWYQIIWHHGFDSTDTTLTVEVWDMQNNVEIEFDTLALGDCWHFNNKISGGPYPEFLKETSTNAEKQGIYLPYISIFFNNTGRVNPMNWADRPVDGEVWDVVIDTDKEFESPPVGAEYTIEITPSTFTAATDSMLEEVKVVPNPYVVRSEYDLDYTYRKMYFTNLPNECTINIYTLSGDLIKTIEHNTEFYRIDEGDSILVNDVTNGAASWDILTDNQQIPAPGLYLYKVMTPDGSSYIGKFAIIK